MVAAAVQLPAVGDEPRLTSRIAPRGRGLSRVVPYDAGPDQGQEEELVQACPLTSRGNQSIDARLNACALQSCTDHPVGRPI